MRSRPPEAAVAAIVRELGWPGQGLDAPQFEAVGGGSIHLSGRLLVGGRQCFLKLNAQDQAENFAAEADGLTALADASAFHVPRPLATGVVEGWAYLAMEPLALQGRAGDVAWAAAGRVLAAQHRMTGERHGWWRDNFIGASPQENGQGTRWHLFFAERRLGLQFRLAKRNGYGRLAALEAGLSPVVQARLADHHPAPSLLHGDLWSGNLGFLADGRPAVFDPAVHYGDRECDLAMAALFGGFPQGFFEAYETAWPLPAGRAWRRRLYQLYHVLNHANLFGSGYVRQAESLIGTLLESKY